MHTIKKGDIATAVLTAKFLMREWAVLRPVSELSRYDLVIDRGCGFEKVQCKCGRIYKGTIMFNGYSSVQSNNKYYGLRSYREEVDLFGVYCAELDKAYLIPTTDVCDTIVTMRITPSPYNLKKPSRMAATYEI